MRATLWAAPPRPGAPPGGLAVTELDPASAPALVAAMGPEGDLVAARLARGCRAFAAWRAGGLVAYGWLSAGPEWIGELGIEIRPGTGEAYIWNCVTLEPHRRQGIFQGLLTGISAHTHAQGVTRLWIGSVGGLGAHALPAAGFTPVLQITARTLPWFRRLTLWPAPEANAQLVAACRRALFAGDQPVLGGSALGRARGRRH